VVLPIIEPLAGKNNSAALGPDLADALAAAAEAAGLTWRKACCRNCMETAAAVSAEYCSIVCRSSIWTMPVLSLGKPTSGHEMRYRNGPRNGSRMVSLCRRRRTVSTTSADHHCGSV
jgi:hypothetical protein